MLLLIMLRGEVPADPIALAAATAEQLAWRDAMSLAETERHLSELDDSAEALGFTGCKYLVHSNRSLVLPLEYDDEVVTEYGDYYNFMFEGEFKTFSHVQIGTIVGAYAVKAVCAMFDNVTVVPDFRAVPPDYLLHVPVLAVETIDLQAA